MEDPRTPFEYDPHHTLHRGYWVCPRCGAEYYDSNKPIHVETCPNSCYRDSYGCIYKFGPHEDNPTPEMSKWIEGAPTRLELLRDDGE